LFFILINNKQKLVTILFNYYKLKKEDKTIY